MPIIWWRRQFFLNQQFEISASIDLVFLINFKDFYENVFVKAKDWKNFSIYNASELHFSNENSQGVIK